MPFSHILIALDESPVAAHALQVGGELAAALGAEVGLVHVVDLGLAVQPESGIPAATILEGLRREGHDLLRAAADRVHVPPAALQFLREGRPGAEIVAAAGEWRADLIVIGTHGRSGLSRLLLGSTAEHVIRQATCAVVVVPGREP